ncbi:MAG: transporter substrate-binding domain-containing protein [Bacteroidales bacterium]|jgi:ABC-type amino acid transport substrate-binding protein|nr:transporter substrate-binding domain-containing protein [Bacteroidales bacterium]
MKKCKKCGTQNLTEALFCAECGVKLNSGKKSMLWIVIATVIIVAGAGIAGYFYFGEKVYTAPENVLQSIKTYGALRVAVETEAPPFNYLSEETGNWEGFEYELISLVAKEMGINKVEPVWSKDFDQIPYLISKEKNKADIFMGGFIANSNYTHVVWSNSYYEDNGYCLIVPDGSAIKSLRDLTGKKIGVYNEDAAEEFVKNNVRSPQSIHRFEDVDEDGLWTVNHLLEPLAKQKKLQLVDAIVYDYVFAKEEIKASDGQLKIVEFNLNQLPYQIGLPKNNYDLLKELNRALKVVMESPDYVEIVKKYLDFDPENVSLPSLDSDVKIHIVTFGETLGTIAQLELGNATRWKEIWDANKTRIPNPNLIHVGNELIIP